jgi:DeoR/GlpR family transcriptional regulator of sugar metabolism
MDPQDRREKILTLLKNNNGKLQLKELSKYFNVSQSSLYKDIDILEKQRFVKKVYGGLELIDIQKQRHNFYERLQINSKQKIAIAKKAMEYVDNDDSMFVDGSSSTFFLVDEINKSDKRNITIVTNSIFIPEEFIVSENFEVICAGGKLNKEVGTYGGDLWENLVSSNIRANKFFFSSYGISVEVGPLDPLIPGDTSMKKAFARNSLKNICLVDSSKFLVRGVINWIGFEKIDLIITDSGIDSDILSLLKAKGLEVIVTEQS